MRIAEIFHSIQGEGELAGVPSVFVRTSGCNLRCRWCDTRYASWKPEGPDLPIDEIVARVAGFSACRHVVLTGGEPMVAAGIHDLAGLLRERGYHLTIETAATVPPEGIACDLASLSPKLAHSTPRPGEIEPAWIDRHEGRRLRPEVLNAWVDSLPFQFKFVVSDPGDLREIQDVLASIDRDVPPHKVLLMPEGVDDKSLRRRQGAIAEACLKHGYRFCPRLHVALYGNTRGT